MPSRHEPWHQGALWPDLVPVPRSRLRPPGRAVHGEHRYHARARHLADALTMLDLPDGAANLRAHDLAPGRIPRAWSAHGIADESGVTSKGARVLEHLERLRALGIDSHDLTDSDGLRVLSLVYILLALRAGPCDHPPPWVDARIVTPDRRLTAKGHGVLDTLSALAFTLDVPLGALD